MTYLSLCKYIISNMQGKVLIASTIQFGVRSMVTAHAELQEAAEPKDDEAIITTSAL